MKTIQFDIDNDGIAVLTIDLPHQTMNVLDPLFMEELARAVDKVLEDDSIVGAVLTTGKRDFMAGADLRMIQDLIANGKSSTADEVFKGSVQFNNLFRKMETGGHPAKALMKSAAFAKPFVAATKGLSLGGGFELALACHHRIACEGAKFGLPEVKVGLLPGGGGTQRLTRLVGVQAALQYITTGKNISASEAKAMGIVGDVVGPTELIDVAKTWIRENPKVTAPWDRKGFKVPGGGGAMHPKAAMTFMGANAMGRGESRGNYPAIPAILSCVFEGSILPIDKALEVESKYFASLLLDPTAGCMIRTLFVNKLAAEKGAARPKDEPKSKLETVGMLGAGLMGAGITYVSAKAGLKVVLLDTTDESAQRGKAYSERLVQKDIGRKRLSEEDGQALLDRIHPTTRFEDLAGCDFIIEAVFEDSQIKAEVTKKAEAVVGPDTIFGSNTSTLPITDLQKNWSKPDNFIGVHFFSPVEKMPLVEMIMGKDTGSKALAMALDFTRRIKKTPIVVNDSRGFYTSRCVGVYNNEGAAMLAEGVSPVLIENCSKDAGYPMGPLHLFDSVNIDLGLKIARQTRRDLGDDHDLGPSYPVMQKMVEDHGRLGMKSWSGFYEYEEGNHRPTRLWTGLREHFPMASEQPSAQDVRERILFRQLVECVRVFDEGVLMSPIDGDLGAILGWGFGPFTGGPFSYIDTIGITQFVEKADRLAERYGDGFAVPDGIRARAEKGTPFYE